MMRHTARLFVGMALVMGCNASIHPVQGELAPRELLVPAVPAWGERIAVGSARIVRVNYPTGPKTFVVSAGQAVFDLPQPPQSGETLAGTASVTPETYKTTLDATPYLRRASVELLDSSGKLLSSVYPYGSVTLGQIEFVARVPTLGCSALLSQINARLANSGISGFVLSPNSEDKYTVSLPGQLDVCQGVVLVGQQTTKDGVSKLDLILRAAVPDGSTYFIDKNTVMSLMQASGAYDYDPTCPEVQNKLDPIANNGFGRITMTKLLTDLNVSSASPQGSTTGVVVVGGGMNAQDQFDCRPGYAFVKHDTYIGDILGSLAPGALLRDEPVCNSSGSCKSSDVSKALMRVLAAPPRPLSVVNMSLGGPLPSTVMFALIQWLGSTRGIPVVTSSGNSPSAPAQYPASYARGVALPGEPTLSNVISVAAIGWRNNSYEIASFNTRRNANLFAAGVDVCTPTLQGKRCLNQAFPQNVGISGTSFAAPVVTGLAALLIEQTGAMPADLLGCFEKNAKIDPVSRVSYPALLNQPC